VRRPKNERPARACADRSNCNTNQQPEVYEKKSRLATAKRAWVRLDRPSRRGRLYRLDLFLNGRLYPAAGSGLDYGAAIANAEKIGAATVVIDIRCQSAWSMLADLVKGRSR
jgi:hypothetical protein